MHEEKLHWGGEYHTSKVTRGHGSRAPHFMYLGTAWGEDPAAALPTRKVSQYPLHLTI
jgi:hypothetical protein